LPALGAFKLVGHVLKALTRHFAGFVKTSLVSLVERFLAAKGVQKDPQDSCWRLIQSA